MLKTFRGRKWDQRILFAVSRGLFQLAEIEVPSEINLAEVAKRVPKGVICLVPALTFHELTTQIPHYVWVAIHKDPLRDLLSFCLDKEGTFEEMMGQAQDPQGGALYPRSARKIARMIENLNIQGYTSFIE